MNEKYKIKQKNKNTNNNKNMSGTSFIKEKLNRMTNGITINCSAKHVPTRDKEDSAIFNPRFVFITCPF